MFLNGLLEYIKQQFRITSLFESRRNHQIFAKNIPIYKERNTSDLKPWNYFILKSVGVFY